MNFNIFKRLHREPGLRLGSPLGIFLIILLASLIYALSIYWFRREIQSEAVEVARAQARETAAALSRVIGSIPNQSLALDKERKPEQQLEKLINVNNEIVAALIVNSSGRIVAFRVEERGKYPELISELARLVGTIPDPNEQLIIDLIGKLYPQLVPERVLIQQHGQTVGWVRFFIDRTVTTRAVDSAAAKMMANLVTAVVGLMVIVLVGTLAIRRQQRIAVRLRSQRDQAEQLAYVGTLAAGLAHEIRNPINALAMQLDMLEEDVSENQAVGPRLNRIRSGLGALEHTVRDFLTFASPERQRPTRVELAAMLESFCGELREANEGVELDCPLARDITLWCDVHALRQILGNLVSNAIRAQNGRPACRVALEVQRQGNMVNIHVDDAGPGVPAEIRPRLFEAFFTTQAEGTGLGLSIALRLAEMNGGRLELAPEPSPLGGARFTLTLPVNPGPAPAMPSGL